MHKTKKLNDDYMGSGKYIIASIKKYGKENFTKEILFIFDNEKEMIEKEKELVNEEFVSKTDTYNIIPGGIGGGWGKYANEKKHDLFLNDPVWVSNYSKNLSEGVKKYILKNGHHWVGKKHTEETKNKMRKSKNVGISNPSFGTCWVNNGNHNKKIKNEDIDIFLNNGYVKGRKIFKK